MGNFYEKPAGWNQKKPGFFTILWKGYLGKDLDTEAKQKYQRYSAYISAMIMVVILATVTFVLPRIETPKNPHIEKGKSWLIEKYNHIVEGYDSTYRIKNDTAQHQ